MSDKDIAGGFGPIVVAADGLGPTLPWPDPSPEMLADPLFEAIWGAIKGWDINVPDAYSGYCGATGNHARAIYDAVRFGTGFTKGGAYCPTKAVLQAKPQEPLAREPRDKPKAAGDRWA